jgi:hypothetical protein
MLGKCSIFSQLNDSVCEELTLLFKFLRDVNPITLFFIVAVYKQAVQSKRYKEGNEVSVRYLRRLVYQ